MNKKIFLSLVLITIISACFAFSFPIKNEVNALDRNYNEKANIATYMADDGEHTIYWTQGITPPEMTNDESLLGTGNYFYKETVHSDKGDSIVYMTPYNEGKGYYDMNKNLNQRYELEQHLCYLGSASNILHWWIEQNSSYIQRYMENIKAGMYVQNDKLVKITPYNQKTWDDLLSMPPITPAENHINNIANTELFYDKLSHDLLIPYWSRNDGYSSEAVYDFFINGYRAHDPFNNSLPPLNTPNKFIPDSKGGYFYPIFGKEVLSSRQHATDYNFYNVNLKKLLSEGKGITLAYEFANHQMAHAITLWGAEYDATGNLIRLFIADSDDVESTIPGTNKIARSMHSTEVIKNPNGSIYLSSMSEATKGAELCALSTLDLAQDKWEAKLNDVGDPEVPIVSVSETNIVKPIKDYAIINAYAKINDTGVLSYRWYMGTSLDGEFKMMNNQDESQLVTLDNSKGVRYYFCRVTNTKNGKSVYADTEKVRVENTNDPVKNADIPTFDFDSSPLIVNEKSGNINIFVNAYTSDGGSLSYQWYVADDIYGTGKMLVSGERNASLTINSDIISEKYYFCKITNTNNNVGGNKTASIETPYKKVSIIHAVHKYGEWEVVKAPTCTETGKEKRVCSVCGEVEYREIPANGHEWESEWTIDVEPTCKTPGSKSHHCKHCDAKNDVTEIPVTNEHKFGEWEVVKAPTCTETGKEKRVCSVCGEVEYREIPATGHDFGPWEAEAGGCGSDSTAQKRTCKICGATEKRSRNISLSLSVLTALVGACAIKFFKFK